jgi:hypothetical protein
VKIINSGILDLKYLTLEDNQYIIDEEKGSQFLYKEENYAAYASFAKSLENIGKPKQDYVMKTRW